MIRQEDYENGSIWVRNRYDGSTHININDKTYDQILSEVKQRSPYGKWVLDIEYNEQDFEYILVLTEDGNKAWEEEGREIKNFYWK
jgi:hypothetical protein